jgi:hypothetical protein
MCGKHYEELPHIEGYRLAFTFNEVANINVVANQLSRGSAKKLRSVTLSPAAEASGTAHESMRLVKCR